MVINNDDVFSVEYTGVHSCAKDGTDSFRQFIKIIKVIYVGD